MLYKFFEKYEESPFFIIDIDSRNNSHNTQKKIMSYDYTWPNGGSFSITNYNMYLCCYPVNKSLSYLDKRWTKPEKLEEEKSKAMFYVKADEFLRNPDKWMSEVL